MDHPARPFRMTPGAEFRPSGIVVIDCTSRELAKILSDYQRFYAKGTWPDSDEFIRSPIKVVSFKD